MKAHLFSVLAVALLAGCSRSRANRPADPISRAVQEVSLTPAVLSRAYSSIPTPTQASPTEVASSILSRPYPGAEDKNVTILESRPVVISHKGEGNVEHWTAVLADTASGKQIVFLQRHQFPERKQVSWAFFLYNAVTNAR